MNAAIEGRPALDPEYPLAGTKAQKMLAAGLEKASLEKSLSGRKVAQLLGYKVSVVISHMANGRVPIPVDRATDLARVLGMDRSEFVLAVLQQRHPELDFMKLFESIGSIKKGDATKSKGAAEAFVEDLQYAAGVPVEQFTTAQLTVMREVASYPNAPRRWASTNEAGILQIIRDARPDLAEQGLKPGMRKALQDCLEKLAD